MTETLDLLRELQELGHILEESKILHGKGTDTEKLTVRQNEIRSAIDDAMLAKYDRLSRIGQAVVELSGGMCLGCHMSIPAGDLNRMQKKEDVPACPNCGRFLVLS